MKWRQRPPGIVAYSDEGYRINISGFGLMTYICYAPSPKSKPLRIGKFTDKEQARSCCEEHFKLSRED